MALRSSVNRPLSEGTTNWLIITPVSNWRPSRASARSKLVKVGYDGDIDVVLWRSFRRCSGAGGDSARSATSSSSPQTAAGWLNFATPPTESRAAAALTLKSGPQHVVSAGDEVHIEDIVDTCLLLSSSAALLEMIDILQLDVEGVAPLAAEAFVTVIRWLTGAGLTGSVCDVSGECENALMDELQLPTRRRMRLTAVQREGEQVTPLELFFDLIFVLAITQCTAMIATTPSWTGLVRGLLVLATLWWAWVGYSWLTSVVDPEEGIVRFAIFGAMAATMVVTLCIPLAFDGSAATFAIAYAVVRAGQIVLFVLGSRDDPNLRRSVVGLAVSSFVGVSLIGVAATLDGTAQLTMWAAAVLFDMIGPFLFGADGWKLVPRHFAERHGLIVLIALGESIVAIGVGASERIDGGIITAVVLGVVAVAAMWWSYFDFSAHAAANRLADTPAGRMQNELARDAYSYAHFLMVAGVVLFALGLKKTLAHVTDPLGSVPGAALAGGAALYFFGLVAFRARMARSLAVERVTLAIVLVALQPLASRIDAIVALAIVTVLIWLAVAVETARLGAVRSEIRHHTHEPSS